MVAVCTSDQTNRPKERKKGMSQVCKTEMLTSEIKEGSVGAQFHVCVCHFQFSHWESCL